MKNIFKNIDKEYLSANKPIIIIGCILIVLVISLVVAFGVRANTNSPPDSTTSSTEVTVESSNTTDLDTSVEESTTKQESSETSEKTQESDTTEKTETTTKKKTESTTKKAETTTKKPETTTKKQTSSKPNFKYEHTYVKNGETYYWVIDENGNGYYVDITGTDRCSKEFIEGSSGGWSPDEDFPDEFYNPTCPECGRKDCAQPMQRYYCVICKRYVEVLECHPESHHDASH